KPGISVGTRANAGPGMIVGTGAKHCFVRSGSAEPGTRAACATPAALLRDTGPRARTPHPHPVRGRVRTRPLARVALTGMGLAGAQEGLCRRGASRSSMPAHRLSTSRVRTSPCPARQTSMLAEPPRRALGLRPAQRGKLPCSQSRAALRWDFAASSAANFHGAEPRAVECGTLPRSRARKAPCAAPPHPAAGAGAVAAGRAPAPGKRGALPALSLALALALASAAAREPRRPRPWRSPGLPHPPPHLAPARLLAVHEH